MTTYIIPSAASELEFGLFDLGCDVGRAISFAEGNTATEHGEQDTAETPNVDLAGVNAGVDFRRNIQQSAANCLHGVRRDEFA